MSSIVKVFDEENLSTATPGGLAISGDYFDYMEGDTFKGVVMSVEGMNAEAKIFADKHKTYFEAGDNSRVSTSTDPNFTPEYPRQPYLSPGSAMKNLRMVGFFTLGSNNNLQKGSNGQLSIDYGMYPILRCHLWAVGRICKGQMVLLCARRAKLTNGLSAGHVELFMAVADSSGQVPLPLRYYTAPPSNSKNPVIYAQLGFITHVISDSAKNPSNVQATARSVEVGLKRIVPQP